MKRTFLSILALLLALCMLLCACAETKDPENNDKDPGTTNTPGTQTPPSTETPSGPNDGLFHKVENYIPSAVYTQMKTYFEGTEIGFSAYNDDLDESNAAAHCAPFVSTDIFTLSDCTVKSITIPVYSTGTADSNGDFIFSIYVLPNDWATLRTKIKTPDAPIEIKVNAAEYGLQQNKTVRKFIKVDLTAYNIKLNANQTLGFYNQDDTLIPAQVLTKGTVGDAGQKKYTPAKYMIDEWDTVGYYYYHSTDGFSITDNSLLFDFELDRAYESEAAYNTLQAAKAKEEADYAAKLAAVKAAYGDKCFSLIGDSISTFNGVTNNPAVHPTLSKNRVYYTINTTVYHHSKTYWGKLSADTGMDLCVINSWSGGKAFGDPDDVVDNILTRSYHLSTSAGQNPDVIFLYYGINDMLNSPSSINGASPNSKNYTSDSPTGNLYQLLSAPNKTQTDREIIDDWFAEVQEIASFSGYNPDDVDTVVPGETYITWEGAYALALQNIKERYGTAEVFCFTYAECNHGSSGQPRLDNASVIIRALAEYFEVGLVDQSKSEITKENCHMYARDAYGLHPNGKGHAAITKLIVETLYENLPKQQ